MAFAWPTNEKLDKGWLQHCVIQYCLKVTSTGPNMKEPCVSEDHAMDHQIQGLGVREICLFPPEGFTATTPRLFPADSMSVFL